MGKAGSVANFCLGEAQEIGILMFMNQYNFSLLPVLLYFFPLLAACCMPKHTPLLRHCINMFLRCQRLDCAAVYDMKAWE
jgi:hypothetical protein